MPTGVAAISGLLTPERFLAIVALAAFAVWAAIVVPRWRDASRKEGGSWAVGALIFLTGLAATGVQSAYPVTEEPSGIVLRLAQAVTAATVMVAVATFMGAVRNPRRTAAALAASVAAFYGSMLLAGVFGTRPAIPQAYWLTPVLILPVLMDGRFTLEWLASRGTWIARALVVASLATAVFAPDVAFNTEDPRTIFGLSRLQGVIDHPNGLAGLAAVGVILELHQPRRRVTWLAASLLTLLLAQSTTAWIAVALAMLVTRHGLAKMWRTLTLAGLTVLAVLALVASRILADLVGTVMPDNVDTLNGRTLIWRAAMLGYHGNPWFGYGPTLLDDKYRWMYLRDFDEAAQAHNQLVQSLGESGILGAAALIALFVALYVYSVRALPVSSLPLALVTLLMAKSVTEAPLRPAGVGLSLFILILTFGAVAAASERRAAARVIPAKADSGGRAGPR